MKIMDNYNMDSFRNQYPVSRNPMPVSSIPMPLSRNPMPMCQKEIEMRKKAALDGQKFQMWCCGKR